MRFSDYSGCQIPHLSSPLGLRHSWCIHRGYPISSLLGLGLWSIEVHSLPFVLNTLSRNLDSYFCKRRLKKKSPTSWSAARSERLNNLWSFGRFSGFRSEEWLLWSASVSGDSHSLSSRRELESETAERCRPSQEVSPPSQKQRLHSLLIPTPSRPLAHLRSLYSAARGRGSW